MLVQLHKQAVKRSCLTPTKTAKKKSCNLHNSSLKFCSSTEDPQVGNNNRFTLTLLPFASLSNSAKPHGLMEDLKNAPTTWNTNAFAFAGSRRRRSAPVDAHILRVLGVGCERRRETTRRWQSKVAKGRRQKQRWCSGLLIERGGGVE